MLPNHQIRLLLVDNFCIRRYGKGREGFGYRAFCGAIRNNWRVATFSERDITRFLAPLGFMRNIGAKMMNARLLKTCKNFRPDLVLIGNCDYVTNKTLDSIKMALPETKIVHINVDAIWQSRTVGQIVDRMHSCDAIFVTTGGEKLKEWVTGRNIVGFIPNVCDPVMENVDVSSRDEIRYDVFFAGQSSYEDERLKLVSELEPLIANDVRFGLFGMCNHAPILGVDYEEALLSSRMALNLNRIEGWKWYSSDRIAHLMGRGILTFISSKSGYQRFFKDGEEAVFFDGAKDLADKIKRFAADKEAARRIAAAGRKRYHELFNASRVLRFISETVCNTPYSEAYEWLDEVYRG